MISKSVFKSYKSLPTVERRALAHAVHKTYMEIFPSPTIERQLHCLERGSYVAITCSPKHGVDETLNHAADLVRHKFRIVPHIAAKMVRSREHLREIMLRLADLGVDSIFVPGGDAPRPLGPYPTALDLLRDIASHGHQLRHVGVAAHPEGHPAVAPDVLLRELAAKQEFANYLVTQMCFDATVLTAWLRRIRANGITMPAWLGLPGVFDRTALLTASLRIGVGASLRFLRHRGGIVGKLLGPKAYRPDALLYELAPELAKPEQGIAGFHLFSFNRVEQSENWRRQFIAGLRHGA